MDRDDLDECDQQPMRPGSMLVEAAYRLGGDPEALFQSIFQQTGDLPEPHDIAYAAKKLSKMGRVAVAFALIDEGMARYGADANLLVSKGVLEQRYRHGTGETYFQQALEIDPNNTRALYEIGVQCALADDYETAMEYFRDALEIEPDSHRVLDRMSRTCIELGDYEGATRHAQRLAELSPDKPINHFKLTIAHLLNGKLEEAFDAADEVVAMFDAEESLERIYPNHLIGALKLQKFVASQGVCREEYQENVDDMVNAGHIDSLFAAALSPNELSHPYDLHATEWTPCQLKRACGLTRSRDDEPTRNETRGR